MTLQELYERIDGNYTQATNVLKMEKLIDRYVRKFVNSDLLTKLDEAGKTLDPTGIFESTHAIKGVCGNLGFDRLAAAASELSEEFRPGKGRQLTDAQVQEKLQALKEKYQATVDGINAYISGQ